MTPREIFESKGLLTKCPNPPHPFGVHRLMGEWQWAETCWSTLSEQGYLIDHFVCVSRIRSTDGATTLKMIVGKLLIRVTIV